MRTLCSIFNRSRLVRAILAKNRAPFCPVAERPPEGSRGLQPTVVNGEELRRGATIERRARVGLLFNRRSATKAQTRLFRGLKPTATVIFSLREKNGKGHSCSLRTVGSLCLRPTLISLCCFVFVAANVRGELILTNPPAATASTNPFVWDAMEKVAKTQEMNENASFTFWVTNTSSAEASIIHTESSCDCTVAKLPSRPWVLKPGESGSLGVKMNLMGRFGRITKEIYVGTSHGGQTLTVHADIPLTPAPFNVSARQRDMMAAKKDRQAVFSGSCAACHALPALGRTSEPLFTKACAICHISEHRAEMVPDLAALKHATNADYWRTWISHGKEGTLMPAFAKSAGGILDTNQIESLVEFLLKKYPSKVGESASAAASTSPTPAQ
jgi:mono/diheme cytochrome c family protein